MFRAEATFFFLTSGRIFKFEDQQHLLKYRIQAEIEFILRYLRGLWDCEKSSEPF